MNAVQKDINEFFDLKAERTMEDAAYYGRKAQVAMYPNEKKQFEDRAWAAGVKMPAILNDIRNDLLRRAAKWEIKT